MVSDTVPDRTLLRACDMHLMAVLDAGLVCTAQTKPLCITDDHHLVHHATVSELWACQ